VGKETIDNRGLKGSSPRPIPQRRAASSAAIGGQV